MTYRVLLVEDEANYRQVLRWMVADLDVALVEATDAKDALSRIDREDFDLVLTDVNMPGMTGVELLAELKRRPRPVPVILMTAYASIDAAVEAIRHGAIDYLQKPFDEERLKLTLHRALKVSTLMSENRRLRDAVETRYDFSQILGESPAMVRVLALAGKVSESETNVLLLGESGTGKEIMARAIHFNGKRKEGPFVAVNCAALPETLLEAELFGAEVGAYTGATRRRKGRVELARKGTLFFDEIGDLPLALQPKLLRLLQERTYSPLGSDAQESADVRFIFATHRNLEEMVQKGQFREDLMYRISVVPIVMPSLKDRGDDVVLLARTFARRYSEAMGKRPAVLTASAERAIASHVFCGNVRELSNVIERAVILAEDEMLEATDLGIAPRPSLAPAAGDAKNGAATAPNAHDPTDGTLRLPDGGISLERVEREFVLQAMERARGNKSQAARLLGLTRAALRYRLEKIGLGETKIEGDPPSDSPTSTR